MSEFKVGDKVELVNLIDEHGEQYKDFDGTNVIGNKGSITANTDKLEWCEWEVEFSSGKRNIYNHSNLKLIQEPLDLTTIDKPWGELDRATKKELLAAYYVDKKSLQHAFKYRDLWVNTEVPIWDKESIYRVKPEKSPEQVHKEKLEAQVAELQKEIAKIVVPE